jgi:hypothetical protein
MLLAKRSAHGYLLLPVAEYVCAVSITFNGKYAAGTGLAWSID